MGTAGRKKEQFMALVDPAEFDRLDALRVVMWQSRAEVNRRLISLALPKLEKTYAAELARLGDVAARVGMAWDEFVRELVKSRQRVPALEELEKMTDEELERMTDEEAAA